MAKRLIAILLMTAAPATAAPDFIPNPSKAYDGFVAINPPRADVPLGALWIDGYGPTGEGASPDNIETVRSLNGLSLDKNLQVNLSASIFGLLGIDPRYRDRYTARFSDLTIVRVKDVARLSGPAGEPRIVEAIKAGTISVSTDGEIGVNARTNAWQVNKVDGDANTGKTRSNSIEGRDMFIAVRVASTQEVRSRPREVALSQRGELRSGNFDGFLILMKVAPCAESEHCPPPSVGVARTTGEAPQASLELLKANGPLQLKLPVPRSDGQGGLYDRLEVRASERCAQKPRTCDDAVIVQYLGRRQQVEEKLRARDW